MTTFIPNFSSAFNHRCLTGALLLSFLLMVDKAQAQTVTFYVAEAAVATGNASNLLKYTYNTTTGLSSATTYSTGISGFPSSSPSANEGSLQISGDGAYLSYAGFDSGGASTELLFNLSSKSFDATATKPGGTIRASYAASGTSGFYLATGSKAIAFASKGGGTNATLVSNLSNSAGGAGTSANGVTYNGSTHSLYYTRNSTGLNGVYTTASPSQGLFTTPTQSFSALTGTGWNAGHVYNGLTFLGADTLFVADSTGKAIEAFKNTDSSQPLVWNNTSALTLDLSGLTDPVEQLSVTQINSTTALVFFTTNSLGSGTSTFNVVSYDLTTGFTGSIFQTLGSSNFTDVGGQYFTGIAVTSVVPEPGTYALFAFGLGLIAFMMFRQKKNQGIFLK